MVVALRWQFQNPGQFQATARNGSLAIVFNISKGHVVHQVAFPGAGSKRGNSNSVERMKLFDQFLERCGERESACPAQSESSCRQRLVCLSARCSTHPLSAFRIREKIKRAWWSSRSESVFCLLILQVNKLKFWQNDNCGTLVKRLRVRLEDDTLLVVATRAKPRKQLHHRLCQKVGDWNVLFGIFQTLVICWESTQLTDAERLSVVKNCSQLSTLLGVLNWENNSKPLTVKKARTQPRAFFRYALTIFRTIVLNLEQKMDQFLNVLYLLSCT